LRIIGDLYHTGYVIRVDRVSDPYTFFTDPDPDDPDGGQYGYGSGSNPDPGREGETSNRGRVQITKLKMAIPSL